MLSKMDDTFTLNVNFQGKDLEFEGRLHLLGYTFKIEMDVNGTPVFFELDENRKYRASADADTNEKLVPIDLLKSIADRLGILLNF
jgi:hypothetical protein